MSNARFSITPAIAAADTTLPDSVFRTLACLGVFGDKNGWCWPSLETIANMRGVSKPRISQDIKILVKRGYVQKEAQFRNNEQQVNKYRILFDTDGLTPEVNPPLTTEINTGLTPEVNPPLTPAVNQNALVNAPKNAPINKIACPIMAALTEYEIKGQDRTTGDMVNAWKKAHADEWIIAAIKKAAGKHQNYVDKILLSWEDGQYPKAHSEQPKQPANTGDWKTL
jgi:hypothetical protein